MTRGHKAQVGDESIVNGYVYVKVEEPDKWEPKHRLIIEEHLGRRLEKDEYIRCKDGNRRNLAASNIVVLQKKTTTEQRIKKLKTRIAKLQDELADLEAHEATT